MDEVAGRYCTRVAVFEMGSIQSHWGDNQPLVLQPSHSQHRPVILVNLYRSCVCVKGRTHPSNIQYDYHSNCTKDIKL